jgi:hypothetical protein
MILIRLATLWWAVLVGFCALGWLRVRFPTQLEQGQGLPASQGLQPRGPAPREGRDETREPAAREPAASPESEPPKPTLGSSGLL